jgi:hypothetical protein
MGQFQSFPNPPTGATVEIVEYGGNASCSRRSFRADMPKPPTADAISEASWREFTMELSRLVDTFKRDGVPVLLLIPCILVAVYVTGIRGNRSEGFPLIILGQFAVFFAMFGLLNMMKSANREVDAKIRELCARYSYGSVTLMWETRHSVCTTTTTTTVVVVCTGLSTPSAAAAHLTRRSSIGSLAAAGLFKPKHARVYRALWVFASGAEGQHYCQGTPLLACAATAAVAAPASQMMQVSCPAGSRAGDSIAIATPAGNMQVVVPQGVSAGQTFSVMVPTMPVVTVNAVPLT